jgi:hypothetical protein
VAASFDTYLIRPLLTGGMGYIQAAVSGDVKRVVAKIGTAPAASWDDPTLSTVEIPLGDTPGDGTMRDIAFSEGPVTDSAVVTFFAETTSGWQLGPIVEGIDLSSHFIANFPWFKPLLIQTLQRLEQTNPPQLQDGRRLAVRGAFPRDTKALPRCSVQISAMPSGISVIGNDEDSGNVIGSKAHKTRGYSISVDVIIWSDQPEERDILASWLADALLVVEDTIAYFGAQEPSSSVSEGEDFETLKAPIFLVTGSVNFTAWSSLSFPVPTSYGHLQLIQEAP